MKIIKFSHRYEKLHDQTTATLMSRRIISAENLSENLSETPHPNSMS